MELARGSEGDCTRRAEDRPRKTSESRELYRCAVRKLCAGTQRLVRSVLGGPDLPHGRRALGGDASSQWATAHAPRFTLLSVGWLKESPAVITVGLTGGIGSGKTAVSRMLAARGAHVIDADRVGHE